MVPKEGTKGKPTTLKYLLNTDFKVEKNALDYMKYVEKMIMQEDGKEAMEYPADMIEPGGRRVRLERRLRRERHLARPLLGRREDRREVPDSRARSTSSSSS